MKLRVLIILLLASCQSMASIQTPDSFCYKGKCYALNRDVYLLEPYFKAHPDRKPQGWVISTGLKRGYVATFKLKSYQLFLKDVFVYGKSNPIWHSTPYRNMIDYVLGPLKKLKIDWFSGLVILKTGNVLNDTRFERYERTYSEYTMFLVEKGNVVKMKVLSRRDFERCVNKHYESYRLTPEYEQEDERVQMEAYFQSQDFDNRFERWDEKMGTRNDIADVADEYRALYLKKLAFRKTAEHEEGFQLWKKLPSSIFNAETEMRVNFEVFHVKPVIQDKQIILYYMD